MKTKFTKTNNKINYIKNKDLFTVTESRIKSGFNGATAIVPHVCNNINLFGAGFASYVASKFPHVKENFHMLGNKPKLGKTQFVICDNDNEYKHSLVVANMIAQNGTVSYLNKRPLNYAALVYCMSEINNYIKGLRSINESAKIEIHAPKFGSGLAGGDWRFIEELINDIWSDYTVYVYIK